MKSSHIIALFLLLILGGMSGIFAFSERAESAGGEFISAASTSPIPVGPGDVFTIKSSAITAGATRSAGGSFDCSSSAGQVGVGVMAGGEFSMSAGIIATVSCGGCQLYGDIHPPEGNCTVNLDDILCVLTGFSNSANCIKADVIPCGGNGIINLDDILGVLAAFSGSFVCPHPCPPS